MRDFRAGHLSAEHRSAVRPVALAYRRTYRMLKAEGRRPEATQEHAYEAAMSAYLFRIGESASLTRTEASGRVSQMIAVAINADPQWFWHGPDA